MREASDAGAARAADFCKAIGPDMMEPLALALQGEEHIRTVRHLRAVLVSFGPAARTYANELRHSPNPEVRRIAIDLWRALGSDDVLADLRSLLDDKAPQVQREALRAIVQIGTDVAYSTLEHALEGGAPHTRDAILQALGSLRDERAAPLLSYMLANSDHRGSQEASYTSFIDALGRVGGDHKSVETLRSILYRGEWWAPGRTARLRAAAARALRTTGSDLAEETLTTAAEQGSGGVKKAARAALTQIARPAPRKPQTNA
jgi:HEAT repeat protein